MSSRWHRSLYLRIAVGLFAFLALMVAAEAALFLWMTDRIAGSMPASSPRRLAALVASDLGTALAADPTLDIEAYLHEQYGQVLQAFVVIMRDGRVAANHDDVPEDLRAFVRRDPDARGGPRGVGGRRGRGGLSPEDRPERRGGPLRGGPPPAARRLAGGPEFAPIVLNNAAVGRVVVLPDPPSFTRVLQTLGPTIAPVAGGVLVVGTMLIALFVFGPARRRLKQVQDASERLGAGDLTARAPDSGGDEVAALARSFNRMADELTSRARALETSDNARRQLLADVSHELMTPLTAIRGYIETLSMADVPLDPQTRARYLRIAQDETHRLEHIIGDLLDLARLEGGGLTMRRERVDVAALFARVAARHERELQQRGIRVIQQVHPGAAFVTGDPDRLEQALQNLAANALRHTPDGGEVSLGATVAGDGLHITVRDSGPGIAPQHLPLIFDRFYKADAARKAGGGSGLGLSIVKAIVERHGGSMTARNDNGAVFEIVLNK